MGRIWLTGVYILLSASGLLLIKLGGGNSSFSMLNGTLSLAFDWKLFVGLLAYIISFLLFIVVLSKFDLGYIYPIASGLIMILSVVLGVIVLKERIAVTGIIGIFCIIAGIILLNIKRVSG